MENKDAITDLFSIIKSLGDEIYKLDTKGNYQRICANDGGKLIFDKGTATQSLYDHFSDEMVGMFLENIQRAISGNQLVEMEFSIVEGETEKWFLAKIAPLD